MGEWGGGGGGGARSAHKCNVCICVGSKAGDINRKSIVSNVRIFTLACISRVGCVCVGGGGGGKQDVIHCSIIKC